MPTKLSNGKYKTNLRYPKKFREITGIASEKYQKVFPTRQLAIKAEREMKKKIETVLREENANSLELKGKIKFKDFYESKWLPRYELGQTTRSNRAPSNVTISNTKDIFRLHILPMFGEYAMNYLNSNTEIISDELTKKSKEYANIKIIKGYVRSMFDIAEILNYIEFNRTTKIIQCITAPKKIALEERRIREGNQALSSEELIAWIEAVNTDLNNHLLTLHDYTLFMLTLYLGDRKSETYALQWKYIDFEKQTVRLKHALDKYQKKKFTKGRKDTVIQVPEIVMALLSKWKSVQAEQLLRLKINQTPDQYLFTYTKPSGEVNCPVHADYLNYRINSIKRRHPELAHLSPHKLRHTYATIARQGGANMNQISNALTHSDISTTKIYVNTPDVVDKTVFEAFQKGLKN
ncbi:MULTISPECIES: tyrosine-type recombinase/integrase [Enterococcus]|uniref:tyrosine-type recombinase/integrase n=1 Tax=Enterococcus TaxID=1350 RepID=UPI0001CEB098|nr:MULTISPECIES: site-specific integrase [Enterococcus]EFF24854.1 phage integrase/recombinase [Enterococcus faecium E1679]MCH3472710.1 site-specific integrase [Enterococcus faecium]MCH3584386.1 site-specific integrase [Enterococcus faecium]OFT86632.1 integrase [Enterococcus sp. HMSC29A04]OFU66230.1 integrase [Enterococcus sp. HMSC14A10]